MHVLFFAWKYLWARRVNLLCVCGITVGVMSFIVVVSVMSGFEKEYRERVRGMLSHVIVTSYESGGFRDAPRVIEKIRRISHVVAASGRVETIVLVRYAGVTTWAWLLGVDEVNEPRVSRIGKYTAGKFSFRCNDGEGAILGVELAMQLGVRPGGYVDLFCMDDVGSYRRVSLPVVTTFKSGMYEYDSRNIYVPLHVAQSLLRMGKGVSTIAVMVDDYDRFAGYVREHIRDVLGGGLYAVKTWEEMRHNLLDAAKLERNIMVVILGFVILVAAFSIAATLSMTVLHKTRQIGILRSMGMTSGEVLWIFLLVGLFMGVSGALLGTAGGVSFALYVNDIAELVEEYTGWAVFPGSIYYLDRIPVDLDFYLVAGTFAATLLLSAVAAVYPAVKAAHLEPVEALRYE